MTKARNKLPFEVGLIGVALVLALALWRLPSGSLTAAYRLPAWVFDSARLRLSLKQDASAGGYHDRVLKEPLPLATIVAEMRAAWPGESATVVNHAALEVATDLLHRNDVEAGEIVKGSFRPLALPPWAASQRIRTDLLASRDFFQDPERYVFRRN
jgi:hypothetical protein